MGKKEAICEKCQAPANVHIRDERAGVTTMRHLCLTCVAEEQDTRALRQDRVLNHCAVVISIGLFVLGISLLADVLDFGSHKGFGWKQLTGMGVAGTLVLAGAVVRVPTVLVIGLITGALALLADWSAFGSSPGFGWQQTSGSLAGAALIAIGLIGAHRKR